MIFFPAIDLKDGQCVRLYQGDMERVTVFGEDPAGLDALDGMVEALEERVIKAGKPFLGICVGMQLMASMGREHQNTPGLNWLEGEVVALDPSDKTLKIPHMGWNNLEFLAPLHPIFQGIPVNAHVYFVHSYGFSPATRSRFGYCREDVAQNGRHLCTFLTSIDCSRSLVPYLVSTHCPLSPVFFQLSPLSLAMR